MSTTIISDIKIKDSNLSADIFSCVVDRCSMPGYSPFVNFLVGDYEYTDALFKIRSTSIDTNRGVMLGLTLDVDVPDIIQKGSATISTAGSGIVVLYDTVFSVAPELVTAFKSGSAVSIPEVISQSNTGFTVKLWDPTTSTYITGSVTWAAHGY